MGFTEPLAEADLKAVLAGGMAAFTISRPKMRVLNFIGCISRRPVPVQELCP